jgi:hypothetical protein
MSNRSSKSAKFIAVQSLKENNMSSDLSQNLRNVRNKINEDKWAMIFKDLASELNFSEKENVKYNELKNTFSHDFSIKERLLAISNFSLFKEYCALHKLDVSLDLYIEKLYCFFDYNNQFEKLLGINPNEIVLISELVDLEIKVKRSKSNEDQKIQLIGHIKFLYKKVKP